MTGRRGLLAAALLAAGCTESRTLEISIAGDGATSPAAGQHVYPKGASIQVSATAGAGTAFTGWSGAATGKTNPITIVLDDHKALTARFGSGSSSSGGSGGSSSSSSSGGSFSWANANAWAGQMVEARNGKYCWYLPVQDASTGTMAIGVAVANNPAGPWVDALGRPLSDDAFEMENMGIRTPSETPFTIDPSVFADDDGQAYLHDGGYWRMVVARLNPDMTVIDGCATGSAMPSPR
jgi:hypothetical protein